MLKQIYKMNGIVYVPQNDDIKLSFYIINNYEKNKSLEKYKLEYFKKIKGFTY